MMNKKLTLKIVGILLCCFLLVSCVRNVNTNTSQTNGQNDSNEDNSKPFSEIENSAQSNTDNDLEKRYDKPTIEVETASAKSGDTITISINIFNNPGVSGALLCLHYSEGLNLRMVENGSAFALLDYVGPGKLENFCRFSWDSEKGMTTEDGTVLTLIFSIDSTAEAGEKLEVSCSYRSGDIYDEHLNDVDFEIVPGYILVT